MQVVTGYEANVAFGLCGPKALPADIVEFGQSGFECEPRRNLPVQAQIANLGALPLILSPVGFKAISRRRDREVEQGRAGGPYPSELDESGIGFNPNEPVAAGRAH